MVGKGCEGIERRRRMDSSMQHRDGSLNSRTRERQITREPSRSQCIGILHETVREAAVELIGTRRGEVVEVEGLFPQG
jgi:hypothetical protein